MLSEAELDVLENYAEGGPIDGEDDQAVLDRLAALGFVKFGFGLEEEGDCVVPSAVATPTGKRLLRLKGRTKPSWGQSARRAWQAIWS